MSAASPELPELPFPFELAAFGEARAERNAYVACATLLVYEYFLQLGAEVEFFWKQRWSLAKGLFLWSRYYSLAFNISNAVVFLQPRPSEELCGTFFHWQNTGASLQVITSHVILQLRLYAMYGNSRWILGLFICLTLGEALAMGLVFGIPNTQLIGTNQPFEGLFICADADPLDGTHWVVYYWTAILVIEFILLCLALYKAWLHRPSTHGSKLMQRLARDSVFYFSILFGVYLTNLIMWLRNRITLDELMTAFSFVLSNIFANRLLISVRESHYLAISPEMSTYMPTEINFRKPINHKRDGPVGTVGMSTMGEDSTLGGEGMGTEGRTSGSRTLDGENEYEAYELERRREGGKFHQGIGV